MKRLKEEALGKVIYFFFLYIYMEMNTCTNVFEFLHDALYLPEGDENGDNEGNSFFF